MTDQPLEVVSAKDAERDKHPQMPFAFGKQRRLRQVKRDVEDAIRALDAQKP